MIDKIQALNLLKSATESELVALGRILKICREIESISDDAGKIDEDLKIFQPGDCLERVTSALELKFNLVKPLMNGIINNVSEISKIVKTN